MTVKHRLGEYPIEFVAKEALKQIEGIYITDENVARLHADLIEGKPHLVIPAGEGEKNLERFTQIVEWLASRPTPRNATIVALGGGVIGDLVGYVAASYMRGVRYIQIPTTLLAQVDSSVGGKVGVDLPQGKNLVGAFYPPQAVYIATELLQTLDERQYANGMAEVWKYGFIMDTDLIEDLAQQRKSIEETVRKCVEHKKYVVENDEYERTGLRATLNFGHTIGHAIEQVTGYERYLHGEAIAIGMVLEARLGERLNITKKGAADEIKRCFEITGLPTELGRDLETGKLIEAMKRDKKAMEGILAFSLLTQLGSCKLIDEVPQQEVEAVLDSE